MTSAISRFDKTQVKKIDAAKRQLDTAIELWFRGGDDVSIHTLAAAAYEIIHAVCEHKKINCPLLYNTDYIRDEHHRSWTRALRKTANFFKHADQDPDPEGTFEH